MILDGYTQHGGIGELTFSYRPALHDERTEVVRMLKSGLPELHVVDITVNRHVTYHSGLMLANYKEDVFHVCMGWIPPEFGSDWSKDWEKRDATNLRDGVVLELVHPMYAQRPCELCKKMWFSEETGKIVMRGAVELRREGPTICQTAEGCPKGTPENQKTLSPKNRLAWNHFRGCAATGTFPDDPIVRRNARIIREAMQIAERKRVELKRGK